MINIIKLQINKNFKNVISFLFATSLFLMMYLTMYSSFNESATNLKETFNKLPPMLLNGLNFNLDLMFTLDGFLAFTLNYSLIIIGIFATYISINILFHDKNEQTIEYLYTKPISRYQITISKIIAIIINFVFFDIILFLIILFFSTANNSYNYNILFNFIINILFFQTYILIIVNILYLFYKKIKYKSSFAIIITMIFFIINFLINSYQIDNIDFFTPFKIFDMQQVILEPKTIAYYLFVTIIFIIIETIILFIENKKGV